MTSKLHKSTEIRLTHPDGWSYVISDDEGGEIVEIGYAESVKMKTECALTIALSDVPAFIDALQRFVDRKA